MAKDKTIKLNIKSNVKDVEKDFEGLHDSVEQTTESVSDLDEAIQDTTDSSDRLEKSMSKAGGNDEQFKKLGSAIEGTYLSVEAGTQAFQAYEGAMALIGVESEELQATMVRVQGAMALAQGVKGIRDATIAMKEMGMATKAMAVAQALWTTVTGTTTGALKILRVALISTGIGALVVAVGMLVANFDKVKEAVTNTTKTFEEGGVVTKALMLAFMPLIATMKLFTAVFSDSNDQLDKEIELEKKKTAAIIAQNKARQKQLATEAKYRSDRMKNLEIDKQVTDDFEEQRKIDQKLKEEQIQAFRDEEEAYLLERKNKLAELEVLEKTLYQQYKKEAEAMFGSNAKAEDYWDTYMWQVNHNNELAAQLRDKDYQALVDIKTKEREYLVNWEKQQADLRKQNDEKLESERKARADKNRTWRQSRLNAERELQDRILNEKLMALQNEKMLLERNSQDTAEIQKKIFEEERAQAHIKFMREYDDVLKNENLTGKEKKKIREQMLKEWQTTEKNMKIQHDNELLRLEKEKNDKLIEEAKRVRQAIQDDEKLESERKARADKNRTWRQSRLNAERELQDRILNEKLMALQNEKMLLERNSQDTAEIQKKIFEEERAQAHIKFMREYDDVLKNENLTGKEKKKIREQMLKEWQTTEKNMKIQHDDELLRLEKEKNDKLIEEAKRVRQAIQDEQNNFFLEREALENEYYDSLLTEQQREENAVREKYYTLLAYAEEHGEDMTTLKLAQEAELTEIEKRFSAERKEVLKAEQEARIEAATQQVQIGIDALNLIANIAEANAGEDVERQKKAFKIKKAADVAQATMDGFKAVLSTYANTPGGPVIKGIAAAVAGGFAAFQIGQIMKQEFQRPTEDTASLTNPQGGGGDVITPEFNIVGDSGINDLASLTGADTPPVQAYVVSQDVTTAQGLDRARVENATI